MRRALKMLLWAMGGVVLLLAILIAPPTGELLIKLTCSERPLTLNCAARMRAMGHVWMSFGWESRALTWYERAAVEGDDPAAYFHLGWLNEQRGQRDVVPRVLDYDKKLEDAAARDQARLQRLFDARMKAIGKTGDISEEMKALKAELEAEARRSEANKNPEPNFRDDFERAEASYRKGAERGFAPAMNNLGQLYLSGALGSARRSEGVPWIIRAAEAGNPVGAINLSLIYTDGMTVPRDVEQAERWSHWTDKITDPRDLASPTLERTNMILAGKIDRPLVAAIRAKAKTREELTVTFSPMQPDPRLPTFRSVQDQLRR
jgi:TPR repeat protein